MGGYSQPQGPLESLGLSPEVAGQLRRKSGFMSALLNASDENNPAQADKYNGEPRLWDRITAPAPISGDSGRRGSWWSGDANDPGASAPESTYSAKGQTRTVDNPPNHRIEDDRGNYRYGGAPQSEFTDKPLNPALNDDFVNRGPQDAMAQRATVIQQARQGIGTDAPPKKSLKEMLFPGGVKQGLIRGGLLALAGPQGREQYQQRQEFEEGLRLKEKMLQQQADLAQPEHMDTDEGPIQYNRQTKQWEPITIGGQRVGPKSNLETTAAGRRRLAEQYGLQGDDRIRYVLTGQMLVAADKPNLDEQVADRSKLADQYGLKGPERQHYILTGQMPPALDKPASEVGSWQLAEDAQGNTVEYNTKTGQMRAAPPNLRPRGTYAKNQQEYEKTTAPALAAQQYAHDYLDHRDEKGNPVRTGAGDEALMEKFFELARPEKGFRMTEPQLKMLKNAQSWMSGAGAKLHHAVRGTWFSEPQRQQIVQTMDDLAKAKMGAAKQVGAAGQPQQGGRTPGPGNAQYHYSGSKGEIFSNDGKTWYDASGNQVGK